MKQVRIIQRRNPNFKIETDKEFEKRVNEELEKIQTSSFFNYKNPNNLIIIPFFSQSGPTQNHMYEFQDSFLTDRFVIIYETSK